MPLLEDTKPEQDLQTIKITCGCGHIQKFEIDTYDIDVEEVHGFEHGLCQNCRSDIDDQIIEQMIRDYDRQIDRMGENLSIYGNYEGE